MYLGAWSIMDSELIRQYLEEYGARLDYRIKSLEQTIYMLACKGLNINSPKQLGNTI